MANFYRRKPSKAWLYVLLILFVIGIATFFGIKFYKNWLIKNEVETEFVKGYTTTNNYTEGNKNWKYTDDVKDIDCLVNWNYYQSDGKTLIEKEIANLTKTNKTKQWCATRSDTLPVDRGEANLDTTLNTGETIAGMSGMAALEYLLKKLFEKKVTLEAEEKVLKEGLERAMKEGDKNLIKSFDQKLADVAKRKLEREVAEKATIIKMGPRKIFANLKNIIKAKVAFRSQAKNLIKYSKTLMKNSGESFVKALKSIGTFARSAGKMAKLTATASKAAYKVAKFLTNPSVVFDIISIALDLANVGGYGTIETKEDLYKIKKELDGQLRTAIFAEVKKQTEAEFKKIDPNFEFTIDDFVYPLVYDPMNSLHGDDDGDAKYTSKFDALVDAKLEDMLTYASENPDKAPHKAVEVYHKTLNDDLIFGRITYNDLLKEDIGTKYINLIDYDMLNKLVMEDLCKSVGGIIVGDNVCTLPEDKCNSRNKYPEVDDIYTEFRDGKCQVTTSNMRDICKEKKMDYEFKTGICKVDAYYCKNTKGVDYQYNPDIKKVISTEPKLDSDKDQDKYKDCVVTAAQQVIEFLVGTTITRFVKGTLTPSYEILANTISPPMKYSFGINNIKMNGKCLDVIDGKHPKIILNDCKDVKSQKFEYHENAEGGSRIFYRGTLPSNVNKFNYCLETPNGRTEKGTNLYLNRCITSSGLPNQLFKYDEKNNKLTQNSLCVNAFGSNNNTRVNLWTCNNPSNQTVEIVKVKKADLGATIAPAIALGKTVSLLGNIF